MNAVSRFDTNRQKRSSGLPKGAQWTLYAVAAVLAAASIFQLFFRYEYLEAQGALWRVDRLTQQTCQVTIGQAHCSSGAKLNTGPTTSTSTSTSISTSPSLTLKTPSKSKPH